MIKTPSINLARRPFRNNRAYYLVFGLCFALLAAASGYNAYDFVHGGGDLARLNEELASRTQRYRELSDEVERMKTDVARLDLTTLNTKSNFANGLILSKLFSWSTLFDRIEELMPPEVKIRSIRPAISSKAIDIQVDGLARTAEALYEFEAALDGSDWFSGVYPTAESTRETKGEINFDLMMTYIPAGKTKSSPGTPASPTAGLPQPVAPAPEGEEAAGGTAEAAPTSLAQPIAQGAAPPTAPPEPSPAQEQAGAEAQAAVAPPPGGPATGKPLRLMTNREMVEALGLDRFLRNRGRFTPKSGPEAELTNDEYVKKHGTEAFLKARGDLTVELQNRPAPPGAQGPGGVTP